ncbi:hypothetical protein LTR46_004221 [Exophiala xenobiotica]|nr:hypothetical protein LTR46_004221 [Exophiala xenobiotica]
MWPCCVCRGGPKMSTQYDEIGLSYESMKRLPAAALERANLRETVTPFLNADTDTEGTSVLDLACGTGYYSRLLLSWGASRVVGVDISPTMIDAARSQMLPPDPESSQKPNLAFGVGDCTQPLTLTTLRHGQSTEAETETETETEQFDIVLGAWLLNYAGTPAEMTRMFANIASHLKPGGHFVGITPHPAVDLDKFAQLFDPEKARDRDQLAKYGVSVAYTARIPGVYGYRTKVTAHVQPREISFENYHLDRSVYEACAREGGLEGSLEWKDVRLPQTDEESRREYDAALSFWTGYHEAPHFGILVIGK